MISPPDLSSLSVSSALEDAFRRKILDPMFSCLGAKSAVRRGNFKLTAGYDFGTGKSAPKLAQALKEYIQWSGIRQRVPKAFHTFAICFEPQDMSEADFERALWTELQALHELDALEHEWAKGISSDPNDPSFAYSFGGVGFFIVGLHSGSSRISRRFERPAMVFNFHAQFEALRKDSNWKRIKGAIRKREIRLQGSINPELQDHGSASQSRQYSGLAHEDGWRAPFAPLAKAQPTDAQPTGGGCPFSHLHKGA